MQSANPGIPLDQIKFDILLSSLREKISIAYAGQYQIQITTQSTNPVIARDMAETLGEIFIAEKLKQELGSVRLSQDFSYEQLSKYERDLQDKIDQRTRLEKEILAIQLNESVASEENRKMIIWANTSGAIVTAPKIISIHVTIVGFTVLPPVLLLISKKWVLLKYPRKTWQKPSIERPQRRFFNFIMGSSSVVC